MEHERVKDLTKFMKSQDVRQFKYKELEVIFFNTVFPDYTEETEETTNEETEEDYEETLLASGG